MPCAHEGLARAAKETIMITAQISAVGACSARVKRFQEQQKTITSTAQIIAVEACPARIKSRQELQKNSHFHCADQRCRSMLCAH